jgi:3-dehydroquinate dehydratase / shikimate dehydrogenase
MSQICVTLAFDDPARLAAEHRGLVERGVRLVEYRLDFLPADADVAKIVAGRAGPIIATIRRPEDGGKWNGSEDDRRRKLADCAAAGAEYVDYEPDAARALPRAGATKRIVSMHDFSQTPADLAAIHARLAACDADVVKLATMAREPQDVFRMLRLVRNASAESGAAHPPTVGLCMGEIGAPSRILGAVCGAPWSYAAADEASAVAPGQLTFDVLRNLYRYESISAETLVACVIGDPIGHSLSPLVHNRALSAAEIDGVYVAFRVPTDGLDDFVRDARQFGMSGVSVTIPHKEGALRSVGRLDEAARAIGAVNTLVFETGGETLGYNTDEPGALDPLEAAYPRPHGDTSPLRGRTALVLGAGGAARAIVYGLFRRGAQVVVANRNAARAEELATGLECRVVAWDERSAVPYDVLVNCTPLGMHPDADGTPLDAAYLRPEAVVFDTVYNPEPTRLLREATERGCRTVLGSEMFVGQAARQFRYFFGCDAPLDVMRRAIRERLHAGGGPK